MVRASMNASRSRQAISDEVTATEASRLRAARSRTAPPGAALDKYPWATNWGTYLRAVRDDAGAQRIMASAWTERVPSEGGFLVPESLRRGILTYLAQQVVYPRAMVIPAETYRLGLPALDNPDQSNGQQGLGGLEFAIVDNGETIPATAGKFSSTVLEAKKVAGLLQEVPNELLADASDAMSDLFSRVIALGYGWYLDDLAINGTGSGEPQGLLYSNAALAVDRTTPNEVLHADVVGMAKALHPASKKSATWLASEDVFDYLLDLYETVGTAPTGQQIPPPGSLKYNSQSGQWELLGLAFETSDHQPQIGTPGDLVLADLGLYVFAERDALEVELSSQGRGFPGDATDVRMRGRIDGRFWPSGTYTLRNGRVCSPLVVLN